MTHCTHPTPGADPGPTHRTEPRTAPLLPFGWSPAWEASFLQYRTPGAEPGRIVAACRGLVLVQTATCEVWAAPSGKCRARLRVEGLSPCAGAWAVLRPGDRAVLDGLLPRASGLSRTETGPQRHRQWLASNLDVVFVLMGLDRDFNPARLERLLALAWGSGARPVVLLTKADREPRHQAFVHRVEGIAPGVEVHAVSAPEGLGLARIRDCLPLGTTGVMVGSSGVGKSTLLNTLAGQPLRETRDVRTSDGRGRHTTSLRELFLLPDLGCLIDTPGIREVGLGSEDADLEQAFGDIEAFARDCRFRDCAHGAEPGCAVQRALAEGRLDPQRYGHFLQLRREVAYSAAVQDERLWREREAKWKRIAKAARQYGKG